jgi:arylsulfatase A-like enzyme
MVRILRQLKHYGSKWTVLAGVAMLAVAGAALSTSRSQGPKVRSDRPFDVLLISLDTTRRDHLSCYGYARETTPNLDALARDSLQFDRAVGVSNWTLPTHASMLTGLYPTTHGAHWAGLIEESDKPRVTAHALAQSCVTLAEVLYEAGYRTGGIVANHWLRKTMHFDQGFEHYDDRLPNPPPEPPPPYRQADEIVDEAIGWLGQEDQRPFFLFLNLLDPHAPFNPPPPFNEMYRENKNGPVRRSWGIQFYTETVNSVNLNNRSLAPRTRQLFFNRYDSEIAFMDHELGRLFDWLRMSGRYDHTLIIAVADHGESFGEHNLMAHGVGLYEPEVAVPLLVKLPYGERTGRVDYGVQHVDIYPTVLDVLNHPGPPQVQGQTMLKPIERDLFVEEYICDRMARMWPRVNKRQWALYRGDLKLLADSTGHAELYDLAADPHEEHDLAQERKEDRDALHAALLEWHELLKPLEDSPSLPDDPDSEETKKRLEQLNYLQ